MTFQDHFSGHAAVYREARPFYPEALFDWLAVTAPRCELVWDVGCGNGQASIALSRHFARVFATDPSAAQIANAQRRKNIDYCVEPAEGCSLGDGSADLVTVAQALHWLDFTHFFAEVGRVLKPGGVFAAWAYSHCHVTTAVDRITDHVYVGLTGPYWPPERELVDAGYRTIPFPFAEITPPSFVMSAQWNADQFLTYLRSWSATQRYIKVNGEDPVALVETELRSAWGDPTIGREVRWEFHLRCGRLKG